MSVTSEGYVLLHPQCEDLVSIIQNEDSQHVKYDGAHWTFSLEIQERVIHRARKAHMVVSDTVWRYIRAISPTHRHRHAGLDSSVRQKLYDFQMAAVDKALGLRGRVLLGDASGLGKKYQALAIASCFRGRRPILIVCSSICAGAWQELARQVLGMDIAVVRKISELGDGPCITNHALVVKHRDCFLSVAYDLVIVDDSHVLLNRSSHIERCFTEMLRKVARVVLVTTATRHMTVSEWFVVFSIILRDRLITYRYFKKRYTDFPDELSYLISRCCLIRNRSSILAGGAETDSRHGGTGHAEHLGVPPVHRRVIECFSTRRRTTSVDVKGWSRELRSRYKREVRRKHNATGPYVEHLLEKGLRVAVVVHFRRTIAALLRHRPETETVVLYGIHRDTDNLLCTQFNNGDVPLVLATYKALKTCTFLRVDTVCIAELHLSARSISRAESVSGHRVMADVHYLVEKGGVERCIWEHIRRELEHKRRV